MSTPAESVSTFATYLEARHDPLDEVITLIVGPDQTKIVAPKAALRLASPYFNQKLSHQPGQDNLIELSLPNDDPKAMQGIIALSKHRHPHPSHNEWTQLASAIDKYDVTLGRILLRDRLRRLASGPSPLRLEHVIQAYATNDRSVFKKISGLAITSLNIVSASDLAKMNRKYSLIYCLMQAEESQLRLSILSHLAQIPRDTTVLQEQATDGNTATLKDLIKRWEALSWSWRTLDSYEEMDHVMRGIGEGWHGLCLDCVKTALTKGSHVCLKHRPQVPEPPVVHKIGTKKDDQEGENEDGEDDSVCSSTGYSCSDTSSTSGDEN